MRRKPDQRRRIRLRSNPHLLRSGHGHSREKRQPGPPKPRDALWRTQRARLVHLWQKFLCSAVLAPQAHRRDMRKLTWRVNFSTSQLLKRSPLPKPVVRSTTAPVRSVPGNRMFLSRATPEGFQAEGVARCLINLSYRVKRGFLLIVGLFMIQRFIRSSQHPRAVWCPARVEAEVSGCGHKSRCR